MTANSGSIAIWGTGGHATSILEAVLANHIRNVVFVDQGVSTTNFEGFPVVQVDELRNGKIRYNFVFAIGDNFARQLTWKEVTRLLPDMTPATVIHPSAVVASSASLGPGTVVLQGALIGAKSRIGDHCIVNTGASLDHESSMGDFSSLAPGVVTGGRVAIGERSAIGIGAAIRHGVRIGQDTVVGSASYVHEDLPNHVVAYGTPARVVRPRNGDDPYLS